MTPDEFENLLRRQLSDLESSPIKSDKNEVKKIKKLLEKLEKEKEKARLDIERRQANEKARLDTEQEDDEPSTT